MKKRLIFIIVLGILAVNCGNSSNPETPNTPAGGTPNYTDKKPIDIEKDFKPNDSPILYTYKNETTTVKIVFLFNGNAFPMKLTYNNEDFESKKTSSNIYNLNLESEPTTKGYAAFYEGDILELWFKDDKSDLITLKKVN